MAGHIHVRVPLKDGAATTRSDVQDQLDTITDDDVSNSSPVSSGVPEASIVVGDGAAHVRVEGHDGDFTKTSERALLSALGDVDGAAGSADVAAGGYETDGE